MSFPRPRFLLLLALLCVLGVAAFTRPASAMRRHVPSHTTARGHVGHAAAYVPIHTKRGIARLVRTKHGHPHTAARLRRAGRHGNAALQAAARRAQQESVKDEPLALQETASLNLPLAPVHVMNLPPMRGTRESLVRQNQRADQEGLARVRDDADIVALLHHGLLVSLPLANGLRADPRLAENRRYCRPWTARFLADMARAHAQHFGNGLQVNSAVRTVEYQRHLLRVNGNAAPADGDTASPHLTGATIDIGKKGMSASEIAWMRSYLSPLESSGKIDVEEEFYQACFHISVYQSYQASSLPVDQARLATQVR